MSPDQPTQITVISTMVTALACLSAQGTLSKNLMHRVLPAIIIWTHCSLQTALISTPLWRRRSPELWRTQR